MNKPLILLLLIALTGCATGYKHEATSASAFDRAMYECEREAAPVQDRWRQRTMIERCMRLKGWQQESNRWAAFPYLGAFKTSK